MTMIPTITQTDSSTQPPTDPTTESPTDQPTESPTDPPTESPTDQTPESPTVSPTTAAPTYSPLTNDNIFLVMYAWVTDKKNNQNNVEDVFGPIEQWDVSAVTSMWNSEYGIGLFQEKSGFNSNISTWNVGKVTNMVTMFKGSSFNNNIA